MSETQDFPTAAVISALTGRLIVMPFSAVTEVYTYAAGEPVWTHQLPRVGKELKARMLADDPSLSDVVAEMRSVNGANWSDAAERMVARFGPTMAVPRLKSGEHERIDPLSELAEKVHPSRIRTVLK